MPARAFLIFTLIVSLLFAAQAQPLTVPVEMRQGGACAEMRCARGCCANVACCRVTEQQKAPSTPTPVPQSAHIQLATVGLRVYTLLFIPPARERPLVIPDDANDAHTLSPLAVSCIRLI